MYLRSSLLVLAVLLFCSQAVPCLNPGEIGIVEVCTASSDDSAQDIAIRITERLGSDHNWLVYVTEDHNGWTAWSGPDWTHKSKCGYTVHIIRDIKDGCEDDLKTRARLDIQEQAYLASSVTNLVLRLKTKTMKNSDFIVEKEGTDSGVSFSVSSSDCYLQVYSDGFYVAALLTDN